MLSVNSKRQLFKPQKPKKSLIISMVLAFFLSFVSGILIFMNNNGKVVTDSNVQYVNSGANKIEDTNFSDKPQTDTIPKDTKPEPIGEEDEISSQLPETPELREYEVMVEELFVKDGVKSAYLTFDDGPTKNITPRILEILDEYNIKASFFVMGLMADKYPDVLKRTHEEGHAICMHSYYHDYKSMYSSQEFFKEDLELTIKSLKNILGEGFSTRVYRFPGGSFGKDKEPYRELIKEAGFFSLDWNTLNGDSETIKDGNKKRTRNAKELVDRLKESIVTAGNPEDIVILMHDAATKQATVDSLPEIIEFLKSEGYIFRTIK